MILEVPTYEELLNSCLQNIPNNIDKREGSIIFNAIAPCCLELSNLYHKLQNAIDLIFLDTSAGDYLDRFVNQFNFKRNKATQALRKGEFNLEIPIGSMFSDGNLSYEVIERIDSTFNYILKCTTYGNVGNNYRGSLTPISYINNLTRAELTDIIKIGQDIEDDDSVRARFIEYIKRPEFGGNISDYKKKALSLNNVGGVKVIPVWNGAGTVKLILSSTNGGVLSTPQIQEIQKQICPDLADTGKGLAPIGHIVTVESVSIKRVKIEIKLQLKAGITKETIKPKIIKVIDEYFTTLNKSWGETDNIILRINSLMYQILSSDNGIIDITLLKLNNATNNLTLESKEILERDGDIILS